MKVALLSSCARLDDAVGKYTFYLSRTLAAITNSKVDIVLAGPMSPEFSAEKIHLIHFEKLSRRIARLVLDRLPVSIGSGARGRFRNWGLKSVRSLAEEIASADLVWDVFASSSRVHRILLEISSQPKPTVVLDYHGITPPQLVDSPLALELHESIEELKRCASNADNFIVHSKFMAEELAARTGIRNVNVIGLFCDPKLIQSEKAAKPIVNHEFVVLFVGRASKHKGLDILIQALKIVRDRGLNACVTVVGNQVPTDRTVQRINHLTMELGLHKHVFWLGKLNTLKLREIYSTSDVLVLPSRHEGFGLPVIEAMWFDLPVIVSDSTALPQVVGNGGLVFKTDDYRDLADKIIMLRESSEIRNGIIRAGRNVRESYTLDEFAKSVGEVCERIHSQREAKSGASFLE